MYVNSCSPSLSLSRGAIAQSLLKAGGAALQDECTKYNHANGNVAVWNIATTGPGGAGLKCKHVIHTVSSQYDGPASEQVICDYHYTLIIVFISKVLIILWLYF